MQRRPSLLVARSPNDAASRTPRPHPVGLLNEFRGSRAANVDRLARVQLYLGEKDDWLLGQAYDNVNKVSSGILKSNLLVKIIYLWIVVYLIRSIKR